MLLEELDYEIPEDLIAQRPAEPRDSCRLLVADPARAEIGHRSFTDLQSLLHAGDLLVVNESKVFPARAWALKPTGGKVELLFLRRLDVESAGVSGGPAADAPVTGEGESWEVLARPSSRLRVGQVLSLPGNEPLTLEESLGEGRWIVGRAAPPSVLELLEAHGVMPLPPYIREQVSERSQYQTVYAATVGSAAAPTAGLHFTESLLEALTAKGVDTEKVTLHVGVDTFRPVTEERIEDHVIHSEHYSVRSAAVARIDRARRDGRRVVAVGTTAVRVLETLYRDSEPGGSSSAPATGSTRLYITPGYRFRAVDALITNFHLPRTSLLALVMAFGGVDFTRRCYEEAVRERYRFFSFGDAMFLAGRSAQR